VVVATDMVVSLLLVFVWMIGIDQPQTATSLSLDVVD